MRQLRWEIRVENMIPDSRLLVRNEAKLKQSGNVQENWYFFRIKEAILTTPKTLSR